MSDEYIGGKYGGRKYNEGVDRPILKLFIVVIPIQALIIFFLVFSNTLGTNDEPVFKGVYFFTPAAAKPIMFVADIFSLSLAIRWSGGSLLSPFSPILFLLPALAIIIKEPASYLWVYTFLVAVSLIGNHLFLVRSLNVYARDRAVGFTYLATTIISLAITTYIGLITQ